jgi:signal transduction histidine kinase/ligand-binding sensor domain-containing protein/DNA-binding response OmpR family regulator
VKHTALLVTLVFLAVATPAQTQPAPRSGGSDAALVHEFWTVRDGLPVNSVNALCQTADNYIWLATFDGLVRFDGMTFTIFNRGNSPGLPSNRILGLEEGQDGSLYMRHEGGHLTRHRAGHFFPFGPEQGRVGETTVLYPDPDGTIWVGTTRGLFRVDGDSLVVASTVMPEAYVSNVIRDRYGVLWVGTRERGCLRLVNGEVHPLTTAQGLADDWCSALGEDAGGSVWIGTQTGLHRYRNGVVSRVWLDDDRSPFPVNRIYLSPDRSTFLFSTGDRLFTLRGGEPREVVPGLRANLMHRGIAMDAEGHIWSGLGRSLCRDDRVVFQTPAAITALLMDHEGSLWVGTMGGGLHRFRPTPFETFSQPEGLPGRNVYGASEGPDGSIWVGTHGSGIACIREGVVTPHAPPLVPPYSASIRATRGGSIWVGHLGGAGTFENGRYVPRLEPFLGREQRVSALLEDSRGDVWFGSVNEVFRWRDGRFEARWRFGVPGSHVRALLEARDGSIWCGTSALGLFRIRDDRVEGVDSLGGQVIDQVRALHQDSEGNVWIGTEGLGLLRVSVPPGEPLSRGTVNSFRTAEGLFDNVIHQVLEDDQGRLWMSTNRGLFWVERSQLNELATGARKRVHSVSYNERDGLRNAEANGGFQPAGVRGRDGRLWFPTQDGVVAVDPARMVYRRPVPPVVLEHLTSARQRLVPGATPVKLAAGDREFEIAYTSPTFLEPRNVAFRYRLEGFNEEWVDAGNRRVAYYTNVPPGQYTFRVSAAAGSDFSTAPETTLRVVIAPRFHETPAFAGLLIVVLAGLGVAAFQWRMRQARDREVSLAAEVDARTRDLANEQARSEEARLEAERQRREADRLRALTEEALEVTRSQARRLLELDRAKTHFFANVSHEFRTPLTLMIGPLEDLAEGRHGALQESARREVELAMRSSRRLLTLVNQILELTRLEAGQRRLRARHGSLETHLLELTEAFSTLAERRRISLQVRPLPAPELLWFDPTLIEEVYLNLLGNAFKFTPDGGHIQISFDIERDGASGSLLVTIRDNGPGIPPDELPRIFERFHQADLPAADGAVGTGIGLSLAREVMQLHGGSIGVESEFGFGAAFTMRLPLGSDHLTPEQRIEEAAGIPGAAGAAGRDGRSLDVSIRAGQGEIGGEAAEEEADIEKDRTTVLVVDDNAEIRGFLRRHLEETYRVLEAPDGESGLALARSALPDLVVADVMMPGMDGFSLCRHLREDPELQGVPIILLTARNTEESRLHGLELGADDYLTKPFSRRELLARVRNRIESRRRLRETTGPTPPAAAPWSPTPLPEGVMSAEDGFLARVRETIERHLGDEDFSVQRLAREVGLDRTQLFRRVRASTGMPPLDLIRSARLEKAALLLERGVGSVSEIAYAVGFKSVSHFSASFRDRFGVSPSGYAARPR